MYCTNRTTTPLRTGHHGPLAWATFVDRCWASMCRELFFVQQSSDCHVPSSVCSSGRRRSPTTLRCVVCLRVHAAHQRDGRRRACALPFVRAKIWVGRGVTNHRLAWKEGLASAPRIDVSNSCVANRLQFQNAELVASKIVRNRRKCWLCAYQLRSRSVTNAAVPGCAHSRQLCMSVRQVTASIRRQKYPSSSSPSPSPRFAFIRPRIAHRASSVPFESVIHRAAAHRRPRRTRVVRVGVRVRVELLNCAARVTAMH